MIHRVPFELTVCTPTLKQQTGDPHGSKNTQTRGLPVTEVLLTEVAKGGWSSFLIGYSPLPGGQHVIERIPADACSAEGDRKEKIKDAV